MGWQERRYESNEETFGGRIKRAFGRIFQGDDFFSWSLPLFKFKGIDVRIHLLYLVVIAGELIWPSRSDAIGYAYAAASMATLFVLVLLHEFGHCFACRAVGGEADRIVMWPLGGLAFCRPPHKWQAALVTTLGGPMVNVAFVPILGGTLLALGAGWGAVIYNPFEWQRVWAQEWFSFDSAYWKYIVWSAYHVNLVLLLFNMLLVMFPMDAGRVLQELLWSRLGYRKSMMIATMVGMILAVLVGVFAMYSKHQTLLGIAIFCGITSFTERRRASMYEEAEYDTGSLRSFGYGPRAAATEAPRKSRVQADREFAAARKKQQSDREAQAEEDRILAKIAESGMQSLSRLERKTLEEATRRRRGE